MAFLRRVSRRCDITDIMHLRAQQTPFFKSVDRLSLEHLSASEPLFAPIITTLFGTEAGNYSCRTAEFYEICSAGAEQGQSCTLFEGNQILL